MPHRSGFANRNARGPRANPAKGSASIECSTTEEHPRIDLQALERGAGALAAATWLRDRRLACPAEGSWDVTIALEVGNRPAPPYICSPADTRFELSITPTAWEFLFRHRGHASSIRVTDVALINDSDEHDLIRQVPPLRNIGALLRTLERNHAIAFRRDRACIRTTLSGANADASIRSWVAEL